MHSSFIHAFILLKQQHFLLLWDIVQTGILVTHLLGSTRALSDEKQVGSHVQSRETRVYAFPVLITHSWATMVPHKESQRKSIAVSWKIWGLKDHPAGAWSHTSGQSSLKTDMTESVLSLHLEDKSMRGAGS